MIRNQMKLKVLHKSWKSPEYIVILMAKKESIQTYIHQDKANQRFYYLPISKWMVQKFWLWHSVWKSQKKSHSTLREKRAKFTFWVDKSWLKMPKMVKICKFLETWSLQSNSITRQVSFNRTKIGGKYQNSKIQMGHFEWFSNNVQEP